MAVADLRALPILKDNQAAASAPDAHVWLSASAGTGKTQVLAARVFRLLLRGTDPAAILCLTFTKAGAAEMAHRIAQRLAAWVRMEEADLKKDLFALGENHLDPDLRATARTLFARVLDAPGGGLRIQTIHGFCQGLLAAFPIEAGLVPGFRPLEAREEQVLLREALAAMLVEAGEQGRERPLRTVGALSLRLGEGGAEEFLHECARAPAALSALPTGVQPFVRRAMGLPSGDIEAALVEACTSFDCEALGEVRAMNAAWGTARATERVAAIDAWLLLAPEERARDLHLLHRIWAKATGELLSTGKGWAPQEPAYAELVTALHGHCSDLLGLRRQGAYAYLLADALETGRDYALAYQRLKRSGGGVDFNDLIDRAVALLEQPGIGEWVRFKLDQTTEHVLIDEAQDTNLPQWRIVRAIADEFFVGRGIYAPSTRTLFTVGDRKQAIFGFQGTDPIYFEAAEKSFKSRAAEVFGDSDMADHERGLPFNQLSLTQSFRSTRPVLEFVDAAIEATGQEALSSERHASEVPGPGSVTLWPPVTEGGSEEDAEGWIPDATRELARRIARQVKAWLDPADPLILGSKGRALRPEDVMILVKRRGELASLLVARLYAEGVPVAGVDRLRLNAPLAVQDLLAAVRFVLQPEDDLSLAALLVSPLIGWTQDELMAAAPRESGSLWGHLLRTCPDRLDPLREMLGRADFATPYRFLEDLLSGPLDGRRKLLRRLGQEARDPIEELLSAALDFETRTTPSLQRFLDWFDRGEVEIVRDPSAPLDAVRVMTAHGSKGLQAPLVILADATVDPTRSPRGVLKWQADPDLPPLPIFRPRKEEAGAVLGQALAEQEQRDLAEHWRLFYVAATRAEEQLVIAGALGSQAKGVPPPESWYAAADAAFSTLGVPPGEEARIYHGRVPATSLPLRRRDEAAAEASDLPEWATRLAPVPPRPPRPLAPSSLGEDAVSNPPPTAAMRVAAERGRRMHALFERLPALAPEERAAAADRWLATSAGIEDAAERAEVVGAVLRVMGEHPDLFRADALAEAPIAATVSGGFVVSGTVDRLLIDDDRVRVIDFKTGRAVPESEADLPSYHVRQMAAYAEALRVIFPGRGVEAALLYTAGPALFTLPASLLERYKPGFADPEQS
ncbi:double-strand break repair helicase AddA [Sphingomonas aracearum]|uniref:DNA 3'-5' helicase n=1 Tax=Sphingomonas aracearum TaxID=2283317 RepID=A0A369VX99_9SPHN|nr:double-strand break repair helicase AddA [Sphingomonas aracearum]RDE06245.1 double-strand break repair helicase AddA [Sphingomonas aracearum]